MAIDGQHSFRRCSMFSACLKMSSLNVSWEWLVAQNRSLEVFGYTLTFIEHECACLA